MTFMEQEAREAAAVAAAQFAANKPVVGALAARLRQSKPQHVVTIGRGSSDHAASYFAYLVMSKLGLWTTSLPMSLFTLENAPLSGKGVASFSFSQSGKSPDLIAPTQKLRADGAATVSLVNVVDSPLAQAGETVVPLHAGAEKSVAATKSFIAQLTAGTHIVAEWSQDQALLNALESLPATLTNALIHSGEKAISTLVDAERLFVLGRGTGLAIAQEFALKLKETCAIQAEPFSGAEVKHGPMVLIDKGYPLIVLAPRGAAQAGLLSVAAEMKARGAKLILIATPSELVRESEIDIPIAKAAHPALDPIVATQSFYLFVEALSRARGFNPDQPKHLSKVTLTH